MGCVTAGPCHSALFGISLFKRSLDIHWRFSDLIFFFPIIDLCMYVDTYT